MGTKLYRSKVTGDYFIIGPAGKTREWDTKEETIKDYKRLNRNLLARQKNQILRELCGTSARQAKIDMGL